MKLFSRNRPAEAEVVKKPQNVQAPTPATAPPTVRARQTQAERARQDLKLRIHRELLQAVDITNLGQMNRDEASAQVRQIILQLLGDDRAPLSQRDQFLLADEIQAEVYGLGPIEPLMRDPDVTDILINGANHVYVERFGKLEPTSVIFRDDAHLMQILDRIVASIGRRIDESSPMVDARLPDGSRVNAIIPPLALEGPTVSIRRFGLRPLGVDDLLRNDSITEEMVAVLKAMVHARLNILVSGGTGSGKTTLLNCLSSFIPRQERIITIEDSAELQLQQPHVVRLESRPPNIEGRGEVTTRDLVRNSLRMRPDRIVVGEVRGSEALDMLQAMNTGHDGSISTVHANTPRDALGRVEMMLQMSGLTMAMRAMRQQIASALDVIVQTARLADGRRKTTSISEVVGMEGDSIQLQDLFVFEREGFGEGGKIAGQFRSTGMRPTFLDRMKASSHEIDLSAFDYLQRH